VSAAAYMYGRAGSKRPGLREAVHRLLLAHRDAGELPTSNRFLAAAYMLCSARRGEPRPKAPRGARAMSPRRDYRREVGPIPAGEEAR
jgi:hypothetical protein